MNSLEKIITASGKNRAYLDSIPNFPTEAEALEAVKRNGDVLQYVKDQSEAVCLEAVKRNGDGLQYVKDQSEAVCLEAVKNDGDALRYVDIEKFKNTNGE